ncbi:DUF4236 domain-containing protein [Fusibacter paucivorans]|uniref:DUF4236 domain-containing protein n=1 Tax=Fusibacter paucivorans TaxID=76009 RepID=A0ABS5PL57_9FIRM|nr:DUF4236 domain-containing protein [Fusibacter paucivorans]MBS7525910.1 DUF4236 domain-containing protein [Fusibacter paucivorans]
MAKRKSIALGNWLKINFNQRGISLTGLKGLRFNLSKKGLRGTAYVPGTSMAKSKTLLTSKHLREYWLHYIIGFIICIGIVVIFNQFLTHVSVK